MFEVLCLAIPYFKIAMLDNYRDETWEIVHRPAKKIADQISFTKGFVAEVAAYLPKWTF